jgi:hypothetical protein
MAIMPRAEAQASIDKTNTAIMAEAETELNRLIQLWVESGGQNVITITLPTRISSDMLAELMEKVTDAGWRYEHSFSGADGWTLSLI